MPVLHEARRRRSVGDDRAAEFAEDSVMRHVAHLGLLNGVRRAGVEVARHRCALHADVVQEALNRERRLCHRHVLRRGRCLGDVEGDCLGDHLRLGRHRLGLHAACGENERRGDHENEVPLAHGPLPLRLSTCRASYCPRATARLCCFHSTYNFRVKNLYINKNWG